jgi:hypothetical protein
MHSFIIRVTAYFHQPKVIKGLFFRSSTSRNHALVDVHNELDIKPVGVMPGEKDIDDVINNFQDDFRCKVSIGDDNVDGVRIFLFDVFEPSWPTQQDADDVVDILSRRLISWSSVSHS